MLLVLNNSATEEINELAPVDIQMQKDVRLIIYQLQNICLKKQIGLDDLKTFIHL